MVELTGEFEHVETKLMKEFVLGVSKNEEIAKKSSESTPSYKIVRKDDTFTLTSLDPKSTFKNEFSLGKEFDDPMPNGMTLKSVASLDGNKITVKSKHEGNDIAHRIYEFSENELLLSIHSVLTPVVATRRFKRL